MEFLTDTEEEQLNSLVQDRKFLSQEIDRLLGWELLRLISLHNSERLMQNSEFCDKIGVNYWYSYRVLYKVQDKVQQFLENLER
jgi:hypothetical protein